MKKRSIIMAAVMALSLIFPMGGLAATNPKAQYGTPVIDGTIDPIWDTAEKIPVVWAGDETATRYNAEDKPLKDSYAKVMWDQENLYFLVYAATDRTPSDPADAPPAVEYFKREIVQLFVSETADDLGSYSSVDNWVLGVNPYLRNSKPSTVDIQVNKTENKVAIASCVRNATNYICEVSIPWSEKGGHKAGDWLGFNFGINDDMDENGARDYYVSWANPSYQRYWESPDLPIVELAGDAPAATTKAEPTTKATANTTANTTAKAPANTTANTTAKAPVNTTANTTAAVQEEPTTDPSGDPSETTMPSETEVSDATEPMPDVSDETGENVSQPDTASDSSNISTNAGKKDGLHPLWIVLIAVGVLVVAGVIVFILFKKKIGPFANRS